MKPEKKSAARGNPTRDTTSYGSMMGSHAHLFAADDLPLPAGSLEALVREMGSGDEIALGSFYDATSHRAFGLALRILRDRSAAEEAVLDTYNQVWMQAARFDAGRGNAVAWLLTMTRSRAIDLMRSRSGRSSREVDLDAHASIADETQDPEASAFMSQRTARIQRAIDTLPAAQRQVIEAAFFEGKSHSEIADAFGTPLGTIKTRIRSGLLALRAVLAEDRESLS